MVDSSLFESRRFLCGPLVCLLAAPADDCCCRCCRVPIWLSVGRRWACRAGGVRVRAETDKLHQPNRSNRLTRPGSIPLDCLCNGRRQSGNDDCLSSGGALSSLHKWRHYPTAEQRRCDRAGFFAVTAIEISSGGSFQTAATAQSDPVSSDRETQLRPGHTDSRPAIQSAEAELGSATCRLFVALLNELTAADQRIRQRCANGRASLKADHASTL